MRHLSSFSLVSDLFDGFFCTISVSFSPRCRHYVDCPSLPTPPSSLSHPDQPFQHVGKERKPLGSLFESKLKRVLNRVLLRSWIIQTQL